MPSRSPTVAFSATASVVLSIGTDSPVSAASSVRRFLTSTRRRSAGMRSPDSSSTTSPGTSSSAGIRRVSPPRMVLASAESMLRIESSAFSALPSWMNPSRALRITTPRMTAASSHRPTISFTKPAPSRTINQDVVELGEEPYRAALAASPPAGGWDRIGQAAEMPHLRPVPLRGPSSAGRLLHLPGRHARLRLQGRDCCGLPQT